MRLTTWNINGITTVLNRCFSIETHSDLLDSLDSDIICFQETKITKDKIAREFAVLPHYDAFFSCNIRKPPKGYSGTCIYTKKASCCPVKAEEGLSGLLAGLAKPIPSLSERIGSLPTDHDFSKEWLQDLDCEGRATLCDFGLFVLINVYCPNQTNDDRLQFKQDYYKLLELRTRQLVEDGREVIVVGDMNTWPEDVDIAQGKAKKKSGDSDGDIHPSRTWFKHFVGPSGPLIDIVRKFHPNRRDMYTFWETKIDARAQNFGCRLDYILITPGLEAWISDADIQAHIKGSDHCPVFIDFHDSITSEIGETLYIWDSLNPPGRQKDQEIEPPKFAAKNLTQFKQSSLAGFFVPSANANKGKARAKPRASSSSVASPTLTSSQPSKRASSSSQPQPKRSRTSPPPANPFTPRSKSPKPARPKTAPPIDAILINSDTDEEEDEHELIRNALDGAKETSKSAWNAIFQPKDPPKCKGHGEDCKMWTVNKSGPTKGRRFWLCARPVGPGYDQGQAKADVNPEFRCNYFQWDMNVKKSRD